MTDKKQIIVPALILLACFFLEAWQLFRGLNYYVDPFLFYTDSQGGNSLHIVWFLRDLGFNLALICLAVAMFILSKLWFNVRVMAGGFLFYTSLNLVLFFLCYNICYYTPVYLASFLFTTGYWYYKKYGWPKKPSKEKGVQVSDTTKTKREPTVRYINKNHGAEVQISD